MGRTTHFNHRLLGEGPGQPFADVGVNLGTERVKDAVDIFFLGSSGHSVGRGVSEATANVLQFSSWQIVLLCVRPVKRAFRGSFLLMAASQEDVQSTPQVTEDGSMLVGGIGALDKSIVGKLVAFDTARDAVVRFLLRCCSLFCFFHCLSPHFRSDMILSLLSLPIQPLEVILKVGDTVTFGRNKDCDHRLNDNYVSGLHCKIWHGIKDNEIWIKDYRYVFEKKPRIAFVTIFEEIARTVPSHPLRPTNSCTS